MNKTLLAKFTTKTHYKHTRKSISGVIGHIGKEADLMRDLEKELLSPRQEAVSRLLELSRSI